MGEKLHKETTTVVALQQDEEKKKKRKQGSSVRGALCCSLFVARMMKILNLAILFDANARQLNALYA